MEDFPNLHLDPTDFQRSSSNYVHKDVMKGRFTRVVEFTFIMCEPLITIKGQFAKSTKEITGETRAKS